MRLKGLLAVLTGGSGGIAQVIARRFLEEGAEVIATGRSIEKLEKLRDELESIDSNFKGKFHCIVMDASDLDSIILGMQTLRKKFPKINILVNNAGSAGPMEKLTDIPLSKNAGEGIVETLQEALESLLGFPWSMTCALFPQLHAQASIINVSTIFSKFDYYGRTAYTVPKAALNMLSRVMAEELGKEPLAIRVNTLYPGPVESDRIYKVLTVMDDLKGEKPGSTRNEITAKMVLKKPEFLSKEDVANTIVFLASSESQGISNHDFEVTHGLETPKENTLEISLSPNPKIISLEGHYTWIIGGSEIDDASAIAQKHYDKGSQVLLSFRDADSLKKAQIQFKDLQNFSVKLFDPINTEDWKIIGKQFNESQHFPNHVFLFPHHSNEHYFEQYGDTVTRMPLEKIQDYILSEIADAVITSRFL
jgi:malonyl-CoA reductase/3-hydroxypropionate dehydrogenase (NADP+)